MRSIKKVCIAGVFFVFVGFLSCENAVLLDILDEPVVLPSPKDATPPIKIESSKRYKIGNTILYRFNASEAKRIQEKANETIKKSQEELKIAENELVEKKMVYAQEEIVFSGETKNLKEYEQALVLIEEKLENKLKERRIARDTHKKAKDRGESNDGLEGYYKSVKKKCEEISSERNKYQEVIDETRNRVEESEGKMNQYQNGIESSDAEIKKIEKKISDAEDEIKDAQAFIDGTLQSEVG